MSQTRQEGARRARGVKWEGAWLQPKSTDEVRSRQQNKNWQGQRAPMALSLFSVAGGAGQR